MIRYTFGNLICFNTINIRIIAVYLLMYYLFKYMAYCISVQGSGCDIFNIQDFGVCVNASNNWLIIKLKHGSCLQYGKMCATCQL